MIDMELTQESPVLAAVAPAGIFHVAWDEDTMPAFVPACGASERYNVPIIQFGVRQAD